MRQSISGWLTVHAAMLINALASPSGRERDDRGDVPGWVMVTVMTATVVAALLPFVREELKVLLQHAFATVRQ
jgi:hypothetical protein